MVVEVIRPLQKSRAARGLTAIKARRAPLAVHPARARQRWWRSSTRRANHSVVSGRVIFGLCRRICGSTARGSGRLAARSAISARAMQLLKVEPVAA